MKKELLVVLIFLAFLIYYANLPTSTEVKIIKPYQPLKKTSATILLTAVDRKGNGVTLPLKVEAMPGHGRLLVDINLLLFWIDTQQSMQIAKEIASKYLNQSLDKVDLIYSIQAPNVSIVGGPSAGAAITVATIAALENKTVNQSILITGTIEPDGSIGQVGAIEAKATAAKAAGAKIFLVPKGQGKEVNYLPEEKCEKVASLTICTINYVKKYVDISSKVGIKVVEVSNIQEVLKYYGL